MGKIATIRYLQSVILERFPPGPERQHWLAWRAEFSCAEETRQYLPDLAFPRDDDPPLAH